MKKIITLGETVLDIIFKKGMLVSATPGGAMLNTAVSLGRLNIPVLFMTEIGEDAAGRLIMKFLKENHVSLDFVVKYKTGKTIIALAFLNEEDKADFDFFRKFPKERLRVPFPRVRPDDIFLFGSFYSVEGAIRERIRDFLEEINLKKGIIIYDPNFRKSHLGALPKVLPSIVENFRFADLVKGSDEDFELILETSDPDKIYEYVRGKGCPNLLLTRGALSVVLKTEKLTKEYPVKRIALKSTIGAGDAFNAGLLFSLYGMNAKKSDLRRLGEEVWDEIIGAGIDFAQNVCQSYENYINHDFACRSASPQGRTYDR